MNDTEYQALQAQEKRLWAEVQKAEETWKRVTRAWRILCEQLEAETERRKIMDEARKLVAEGSVK